MDALLEDQTIQAVLGNYELNFILIQIFIKFNARVIRVPQYFILNIFFFKNAF
jgi:hypothetical protein